MFVWLTHPTTFMKIHQRVCPLEHPQCLRPQNDKHCLGNSFFQILLKTLSALGISVVIISRLKSIFVGPVEHPQALCYPGSTGNDYNLGYRDWGQKQWGGLRLLLLTTAVIRGGRSPKNRDGVKCKCIYS